MMPGPLLHLGATVICAHGGQATPTVISPRVLVSGQPVALATGPYAVAACILPPPPAANGPCVTAQFTTSALRVKSMAQPVLLLDSLATCAPTGTPLIPLVAQPRVIGQ
jgi:hypothetical protein